DVTQHLIARISALDDAGFLGRLPALREAFDVLSPAARQRFLDSLRASVGEVDLRLDYAPNLLGRWADADHAGRLAAAALDEDVLIWDRA
ncbi:MAG TPA: DUF5682 family protein, partial [Chloroflexota bacterium]|nr:DUF5682 family protein [Chloroflexota bacterium]